MSLEPPALHAEDLIYLQPHSVTRVPPWPFPGMLWIPSFLCLEHSLCFQDSHHLLPLLSIYPWKAHILVRPIWLILGHFSTNALPSAFYVAILRLGSHCYIEQGFLPCKCIVNILGQEVVFSLYFIIFQRLLNPTCCESMLCQWTLFSSIPCGRKPFL